MDNGIDGDRQELLSLQSNITAFGKRRLVLWAIRWTIGFAIIGIVVFFKPAWAWLWWVGLGFAALTPVTALISRWIFRRKIRDTENRMAELEKLLREADGD